MNDTQKIEINSKVYSICEERLGKGSFAVVYKVYDNEGKFYALKEIEILPDKKNLHQNEIDIMKSLTHKNIVQFYGSKIIRNTLYILMELCTEGSLKSYIARVKKVPEKTARRIMLQIVSGMEYLHSKNISHRDLKPDNILLTKTDKLTVVKIVDFGLSKQRTDAEELMSTIVGTKLYLAPECVPGSRYFTVSYSSISDIWSLGTILYEMIFGCSLIPPNIVEHHRFVQSPDPIVIPFCAQLSDSCRHLLGRMLEKDPEKRINWRELFAHPWVNPPKKNSNSESVSGHLPNHSVDQSILNLNSTLSHLQINNSTTNNINNTNNNTNNNANNKNNTNNNTNKINNTYNNQPIIPKNNSGSNLNNYPNNNSSNNPINRKSNSGGSIAISQSGDKNTSLEIPKTSYETNLSSSPNSGSYYHHIIHDYSNNNNNNNNNNYNNNSSGGYYNNINSSNSGSYFPNSNNNINNMNNNINNSSGFYNNIVPNSYKGSGLTTAPISIPSSNRSGSTSSSNLSESPTNHSFMKFSPGSGSFSKMLRPPSVSPFISPPSQTDRTFPKPISSFNMETVRSQDELLKRLKEIAYIADEYYFLSQFGKSLSLYLKISKLIAKNLNLSANAEGKAFKQFSKEVEENLEFLKANTSPDGNANKIIFDYFIASATSAIVNFYCTKSSDNSSCSLNATLLDYLISESNDKDREVLFELKRRLGGFVNHVSF